MGRYTKNRRQKITERSSELSIPINTSALQSIPNLKTQKRWMKSDRLK
jgi:hypothetical protein